MKLKPLPSSVLRRVSKAHILAAGAVVLIGVFIWIMGSTSSWLFSNDTVENLLAMRASQYNVYLKENFSAPTAPKPGDVIAKEAWVTNQGTSSAFVRVKVFPTLVAPDGVSFLPANLGSELTYDGTLNTTDWRDGGDGYYYYLGKLEPGASTPKLFARVKLVSGIGGGYQNAVLTVTLLCESVQNDGYGYRAAWWAGDAATPPAGSTLLGIDNILKALIE